jgi:hypothetical protein
MAELASHPIRTESVFPKTIATLLSKTVSYLHTHQLLNPMGEPALPSIGTAALLGKIFAELGFML